MRNSVAKEATKRLKERNGNLLKNSVRKHKARLPSLLCLGKAYYHRSKVEAFKIVFLKDGDNFVSLCLSLIHLVYIWARL